MESSVAFGNQAPGQDDCQLPIVQGLQDQGKGRFYCWKKGQHPDMPVPTMVADDAVAASEWFIDKIRASTPWPRWTTQPDGTHGPETLVPETRICIDSSGHEYLVGEVDWLDSDDMRHGQLWQWFGPEEKDAFARLWSAMKRGKSPEWF